MIIAREEKKMERERERDQRMIPNATASQATKKSGATVTAKPRRAELLVLPRRTHSHSISFDIIFFKENEIMDYFL